jgi:hypothetical protein
MYVEGVNPRRTPLIGKIAIYGWKLNRFEHYTDYSKVNAYVFYRLHDYVALKRK